MRGIPKIRNRAFTTEPRLKIGEYIVITRSSISTPRLTLPHFQTVFCIGGSATSTNGYLRMEQLKVQMKILNLGALYLITLAAGGIARPTYAAEKQLTVSGKNLTLAAPLKCASARLSRKELAKYLAQYDPSGEPNEDITDETPWTHEEIEATRRALVLYGFQYPNGQVSVITWTDFDGDGVCDFSASAGIGGAKSIDRHFLFRGLAGGGFRLVDSDYSYKSTSITILPHISIRVAGEKLPLLVKEDNILQWQAERKRFVTCDMIKSGPEVLKLRAAFSSLAQLCTNPRGIFDWAADQLPHKNELPNWTPPA